jgi:hypothetical protein
MNALRDFHPAVRGLNEALHELSEVAADLTLIDAGELSSMQVQLGEIVLQIAESEKFRRDVNA